jgi:adenylate cyclase class 2
MDPLPYKDFTLKAKVPDVAHLEKILREAGARHAGLDRQQDTYFKTDVGKLKLRLGTLGNLITHYVRRDDDGIEKTIVYRYDLNPRQDEIDNLFNHHDVIGVVEKQRNVFYVGETKVHLDTMPDGKMYVEIEAIDRSNTVDSEVLKGRCIAVKEMLRIPDGDLIKTGYL